MAKGISSVATIMFIDIIGCSTISNILGVKKYGKFLEAFERITIGCIDRILRDIYPKQYQNWGRRPPYLRRNVRGDEVCMILFSEYEKKTLREKKLARMSDANTAIEIAVQIKQDWLGCVHNRNLLDGGKAPCNLAIGINSGPVHITKKQINGKIELLPEGYTINLAKRIEGESRNGKYSGILVGQLTKSLYDDDVGESAVFFDKVKMVELKGILQPVPTYEIKYFTLTTGWREFLQEADPFLSERIKQEERRIREVRRWTFKAWETNRSSAWLANVYGIQCLAVKQYRKAERTFLELRSAHPKDPEPHCLIGYVYGEQDEFEEEKKCYIKAIQLDPYFSDFHYYLGQNLWYSLEEIEDMLSPDKLEKKVERILACFNKATYLHERSCWAYYDKACLLNYYTDKLKRSAWRRQAQAALNKAKELEKECEILAASDPYLEGLNGGPQKNGRRKGQSASLKS